jgi:hypothetical protein
MDMPNIRLKPGKPDYDTKTRKTLWALEPPLAWENNASCTVLGKIASLRRWDFVVCIIYQHHSSPHWSACTHPSCIHPSTTSSLNNSRTRPVFPFAL